VKLNKGSLFLGFCAMVLFSVMCAANLFAADEVTVTGTVYATAYDDKGDVTAAVIAGLGEEYIIVDNVAGKELFKLDFKLVKASGVIGADSEGNNTITVTKYEVIQE